MKEYEHFFSKKLHFSCFWGYTYIYNNVKGVSAGEFRQINRREKKLVRYLYISKFIHNFDKTKP